MKVLWEHPTNSKTALLRVAEIYPAPVAETTTSVRQYSTQLCALTDVQQ